MWRLPDWTVEVLDVYLLKAGKCIISAACLLLQRFLHFTSNKTSTFLIIIRGFVFRKTEKSIYLKQKLNPTGCFLPADMFTLMLASIFSQLTFASVHIIL